MEVFLVSYLCLSITVGSWCWLEEFYDTEKGVRRWASLGFCIVSVLPLVIYFLVIELVDCCSDVDTNDKE